jgi:hypothetical protein
MINKKPNNNQKARQKHVITLLIVSSQQTNRHPAGCPCLIHAFPTLQTPSFFLIEGRGEKKKNKKKEKGKTVSIGLY